ncbi:hypothetical protein F183_A17350 [Bryobacterales bacterium F-183]|nr:hypothetical protein F183_A17350 [Bryobacterales bacterium F-183]
MKINDLRAQWERFAQTDPMWAILTVPGTRNNAWDPQAFFETGKHQITALLQWVERESPIRHADRALDFGCGMGRLTQALAANFTQVVGVDISEHMVQLAREHNRHGAERCQYVANHEPNLRIFGDAEFDFVHSNITLQHIDPSISRGYLAEFCRVLKPGGTLCFQIPDTYLPNRNPVRRWARRLGLPVFVALHKLAKKPVMEMHGIPEAEVRSILRANGVDVVATREDGAAGPLWRSVEYIAVKR